jgi:transcription factor E2F3
VALSEPDPPEKASVELDLADQTVHVQKTQELTDHFTIAQTFIITVRLAFPLPWIFREMEAPDRDSGKQTLASLTRDFIGLLRSGEGTEVDLAMAEHRLKASRRRLYDVANVLEGVGLVTRTDRSAVRWIGRPARTRTRRPPVKSLQEREADIDRMTEVADRALADLMHSERFELFGWFSEEDFAALAAESSFDLFAIKGPRSMTLEVFDEGDSEHRVVCKAVSGRIELMPIGGGARNRGKQHRMSAMWKFPTVGST